MPKLIPDDDAPTNGNGHPSSRVVPNGREDGGQERLGVNVYDLDRIPGDVRQVMGLARLLDVTRGVRVDKDRPDEFAVAFKCPLLQAAMVLDIIRRHDKEVGDHPTRTYLCRGKTWTKLPGDAILSLVGEGGTCRLNPRVFRVRVNPAEIIPLPPVIG